MKAIRISFFFGLMMLLAVVQSVFAQGGGRRGGGSSMSMMGAGAPMFPPTPDEGPTCDIDAVIYIVRMPVDQVTHIDLDALEKAAAKAEDFEKALGKIGKPKPLYRARQSVKLESDSININSQTPYVSSSNVGMTGGSINTVTYTNVGAIFDLAGLPISEKLINLKMRIQVSIASDSATTISDKVKAPIFRTATLIHNGQIEADKPFVFLSVDAAANEDGGDAVAYIAKVKLGKPNP